MQPMITLQGEQVPALGFGTWHLEGKACAGAVLDALQIGYRHIDTAAMYRNEREVGDGIRQSGVSRPSIFLTTKILPDNFAPRDAPGAAEACLTRLGLDYIDLLLLHWPNPRVPVGETLAALKPLQKEGRIRHLGLSNYSPDQVTEAAKEATIFCNQVLFHPFVDRSALLEQAQTMDYLVTAYTPLAKGRVLRDPTLKDIAAVHDKSPAQVALRWLTQLPKVAAIPKAATAEHRNSNFNIFDFELSSDEMARIADLGKG